MNDPKARGELGWLVAKDLAYTTFIWMFCFPAGTPVATASGPRPIEEIQRGDLVWASDMRTGEWALKPVVEPLSRLHSGRFVTLKMRRGDDPSALDLLEATDDHPIWVIDGPDLDARPRPAHIDLDEPGSRLPGRWVDAIDVRAGDRLLARSGEPVVVESVTVDERETRVYNTHIADWHTYAVGSPAVLVHNARTKDAVAKTMGRKAENRGWAEAIAGGERPLLPPSRKNSNTPGLDYATVRKINGVKTIVVVDAKYRRSKKYPVSVPIDKQQRWTQEIRDYLENAYRGSDRDELLDQLNKGHIMFEIYGWPR